MKYFFLSYIIFSLLLIGCNGGDADNAPNENTNENITVEPNKNSTAKIIFPAAPKAQTYIDSVRVTGTAEDPDGIQTIHVNGIEADSDDNFHHWTAIIPLQAGDNHIQIDITDNIGSVMQAVAQTTITYHYNLRSANSIYELDSQSLLLASWAKNSILKYDTKADSISIIANQLNTKEPAITSLKGFIVDKTNNRVFAPGNQYTSIVEINLGNGDKRIFHDMAQLFNNETPTEMRIHHDPSNHRILILTKIPGQFNFSLYSIDLNDASGQLLFSDSNGTGLRISSIRQSIFDSDNNRIIATGSLPQANSNNRFFTLDIDTGTITAIPSPQIDNSNILRNNHTFIQHVEAEKIYFYIQTENRIYEFNLADGTYTETLNISELSSTNKIKLSGITLDSSNKFIAFDSEGRRLIKINPVQNSFETLYTDSFLNDFSPLAAADIAYAKNNHRLLIPDYIKSIISSDDLNTGTEDLIFTGETVLPQPVDQILEISLDEETQQLFLVDNNDIYSIDLNTKSYKLRGSFSCINNNYSYIADIKYNNTQDRLYLLAAYYVYNNNGYTGYINEFSYYDFNLNSCHNIDITDFATNRNLEALTLTADKTGGWLVASGWHSENTHKNELYYVDLTTFDIQPLSVVTDGDHPPKSLDEAVLDIDNNRLILIDYLSGDIHAFDLSSHILSLLRSNAPPGQMDVVLPGGVTLDEANKQLYISDFQTDEITQISLDAPEYILTIAN